VLAPIARRVGLSTLVTNASEHTGADVSELSRPFWLTSAAAMLAGARPMPQIGIAAVTCHVYFQPTIRLFPARFRPKHSAMNRLLLTRIAILLSAPALLQGQNSRSEATAPSRQFGLVIEGGIEYGGDQLVELLFTNGGTQKLLAGQGGTVAAGLQFQPTAAPQLSVMATVGYKIVTNASSNSSIGLTRIPIEVIGHWNFVPDWSVGVGVVRHAAVKFDGDGFLPDADLTASTGATVEIGWRWATLSYTGINYAAPSGAKLNAGSFGASVRWIYKGKKRR
jgi:hypothetical protein